MSDYREALSDEIARLTDPPDTVRASGYYVQKLQEWAANWDANTHYDTIIGDHPLTDEGDLIHECSCGVLWVSDPGEKANCPEERDEE